MRVEYVLELSQGRPIVGTYFVYNETLAGTFAAQLAQQRGCAEAAMKPQSTVRPESPLCFVEQRKRRPEDIVGEQDGRSYCL